MANLLLICYALVLIIFGLKYYNQYPYYSESWLKNDACVAIGYIFISATFVIWFTYALEGIGIYLKIYYAIEIQHQLTRRAHVIISLCIWVVSFVLALTPFIMQGRYNKVATCLPFYPGEFDQGFKFVFLYTSIAGAVIILLLGLSIKLIHSIVKSKSVCTRMEEENHKIKKHIVKNIVSFIIMWVVMVTFLVMSCIGGPLGKFGREWFIRLCIIEVIVNPLVGSLHKKKFHVHTKRILEKFCPCCFRDLKVNITERFSMESNSQRNENLKSKEKYSSKHSLHDQIEVM